MGALFTFCIKSTAYTKRAIYNQQASKSFCSELLVRVHLYVHSAAPTSAASKRGCDYMIRKPMPVFFLAHTAACDDVYPASLQWNEALTVLGIAC